MLQLSPALKKYHSKLEETKLFLNQLRDDMYGEDTAFDSHLIDTPINIIDNARHAIETLQQQMWYWRNHHAKEYLANQSPNL